MLIDFFYTLRAAKLPVSHEGIPHPARSPLQAGVVGPKSDDAWALDDFYNLAPDLGEGREALRQVRPGAFGAYFKGVELVADFTKEIPPTGCARFWKTSSRPSKSRHREDGLGRVDGDAEKAPRRTEKERHEGGNKWIGTGGTSPFGHGGYNPQGVRIGGAGKNKSAVKVWGAARLPRLRRPRKSWARATSRWRCAACASLRAKGMSWSWTCRHHPQHGRQRGLPGHQDGARAPQQREGAAADGRGRHDGRAHPAGGGTLQRREERSSSTWSSITSTTACTTSCGRTTAAALPRSFRPGTSSRTTKTTN